LGGEAYWPCGIEPALLGDWPVALLFIPAFGLVAVWLGRESFTEDCGLLPVWLGIELSDAVEDGVPPLPGPRLPLPPSGFEPLGIFASFEGEAMPGDAAPPLEGAGVLLIAGLPTACSGVCAEPCPGDSNSKAASAAPDKPKRQCMPMMITLRDAFSPDC